MNFANKHRNFKHRKGGKFSNYKKKKYSDDDTPNNPNKGWCIHLISRFSDHLEKLNKNALSLPEVENPNFNTGCIDRKVRCPDWKKSHDIFPNDDASKKQTIFKFSKLDKNIFNNVFSKLIELFKNESSLLKAKIEDISKNNHDCNNMVLNNGKNYWIEQINYCKNFLDRYTETDIDQLTPVIRTMINVWRLVESYLYKVKEKTLANIMNLNKSEEVGLLWNIYPLINKCIIQELYLKYIVNGSSVLETLDYDKPINGKSRSEWIKILNGIKTNKISSKELLCPFSDSICNRGCNSYILEDTNQMISLEYLVTGESNCVNDLYQKLDKDKKGNIIPTSKNFHLLPFRLLVISEEIIRKAESVSQDLKNQKIKDSLLTLLKGEINHENLAEKINQAKIEGNRKYTILWERIFNQFFLNYNKICKKIEKNYGKNEEKVFQYRKIKEFYDFFSIRNNFNCIHLNTDFVLKNLLVVDTKKVETLTQEAEEQLKSLDVDSDESDDDF